MTIKGIVRYILAVVLFTIFLSIVLPLMGIPRSQIVAPPIAYAQASGTTVGYVTNRSTSPTADPFHVGDLDYFVNYQFRGPALPVFGQRTVLPGAKAVYKCNAEVTQAFYNAAKYGMQVPVRYDPGDPEISGISAPGGGRNGIGAGSLLTAWILWDLAILAVAYPLAMLLERVVLRESY